MIGSEPAMSPMEQSPFPPSMEMNENIADGFLRSAERFPNRIALEVDGQAVTFSSLLATSAALAATIIRWHADPAPPLTAVFGYRSAVAFAGLLGSALASHGYVPLNPDFPVERSRFMLERSGCRTLIVDDRCSPELLGLVSEIPAGIVIIMPETEDVGSLASRCPQHRFIGRKSLEAREAWKPRGLPTDAIAYLLFTSGSTGIPKGVAVAHRNVRHYVRHIVGRYAISEDDRVSQTFDTTFDLSAHDMFVAWERGACVCCPTKRQLINPGNFINDSRLTIWFSVPSTAVFMKRLGMLKGEKYPRLRLSLFCGEALPTEVAAAWQRAAPNSILENIYGPTELTIACTGYRWDPLRSESECELGLVPIGEPFPEMQALIVDEMLEEVRDGTSGELIMSGPQVTLGYWQDPERTRQAFVTPPGRSETYYRTGDRVRRAGPGRPLIYLGRLDNQLKVCGHRVELGEIESVVREETGIDGVVAVGWPVNASGADGIEVFVEGGPIDVGPVNQRIASRLPLYMRPRRFHVLPRFPVNANGKYDRPALTRLLASST